MIETARASEMSAYFYETTSRHISKGCHFHTRREKLKSHNQRTCELPHKSHGVEIQKHSFILRLLYSVNQN
jgi:hypothetical protein